MTIQRLVTCCGVALLVAASVSPLPAQRLPLVLEHRSNLTGTADDPGSWPIGYTVLRRDRRLPSSVKWGMVIGGVTGATIAAVAVLSADCQGIDCELRKVLLPLPMGIGAAVGIVVGGRIGGAIDQSSRMQETGILVPPPASGFQVGLSVPLRVARSRT